MQKVKKGDKVKVHYTGKLKDGTVFDSSDGRDPLEFTVGAGQMIPGFDTGVEGMGVGEKKTLELDADDAYGQVRKELVAKIPKADIPSDLDVKVGQVLQMQHPQGFPITVTVTDMDEETITLDGNPPLAGKDLIFDVEMVEIA